ncbi:hypothetical protein ACK03K_33555 [[Kitasatospora] papulosa]|uniref:hypothetical protein n=1 Tax=[Kitasatospora] papulosa TaxID=1464011 RepID=UPI00390843AE
MEILNAPTGTGKSVLVRVMAAWFAATDRRIASLAGYQGVSGHDMDWNVREDLDHLHRSGSIKQKRTYAHLMSSPGCTTALSNSPR